MAAAIARRKPAETRGWVDSALRKNSAANEIAMIAVSKARELERLMGSMMSSWCTKFLVLSSCLAVLALAGTSCKRKSTNPEMEVKAYVAKAEALVEARDLGGLKELIDPGYSDGKGLNKRRVISLLQLQFLRRQSIHLLIRILDLTVSDDQKEANVSLLVAMAGRALDSVDSLKGLRADLMRFNFRLVRDDDEWRLQGSNWNRAKFSDFIRIPSIDEQPGE